MRTRVKICGITYFEDALDAVRAGADAIGLVFYEKSPRFVSNSLAQKISQQMPAFVSRVALFKDADKQAVESVLEVVDIDIIQFHGSESVDFCEQFSKPYIKALGVKGAEHDVDYLISSADRYRTAKALLFDGHAPGDAGGTGESFDWLAISTAMEAIDKTVILAGGLTVENVRSAIETVHPFAVDVSSGVESSPGIKDKTKMDAFIQQVGQAC
jgi:phosphoribosylanthranilate isomerase